jgi:3-oxoacyl-[acyl-carrier protein] reductase
MKYALVTGGTKGIGRQICIDLLNKGYFVITNYAHDDKSAQNARDDFSNYSNEYDVIKFDQSKDCDIESFIHFIRNKTKEIHCIICNTGSTSRKNFESLTNFDWENVFKVNIHSHFYLIRDLNLIIQNKAKIVFIGSLLGEVPHATSLVYGVTKAAMHALARNLVKEYSEREVTVNIIAPGFVETEWQKDKPSAIRNNIYNKTALKRFATVEEVSMACMMLVDNDFINGAIISVDGGYNYL